ncbi:hypothetical protein [Rhodococcus sp. 11-3]|uniref:hypothetical protein n=1 Tax=Rhodococcus sp. 11-3 TaxID=2854796 RepID=UPI00203A4B61|nr:hypothetical protein [Rhodococcus sp. 11-3]USC18459.1 hypothetical protein KZJ41_28250 [Rhodococcus sp. 11-3]
MPLDNGIRDPLHTPTTTTLPTPQPLPPNRFGPSGIDLDHLRDSADALAALTGTPGDCWHLDDARALWHRDLPGDRDAAQRIADHLLAVDTLGPLGAGAPAASPTCPVVPFPSRRVDLDADHEGSTAA